MDNAKRSRIRNLVKTREDVQKARIQMSNRLSKKKNGDDQRVVHADIDSEEILDLVDIKESLESIEMRLGRKILKELKNVPLYTQFLKNVKGVGAIISAVIISEVDIEVADTVSKLWQYCGFNPDMHAARVIDENGNSMHSEVLVRGDRMTKGYMSPYNTYLKTKLVKVLGDCFIRSNSPYRRIYDVCKAELEVSDKIVKGKDTPWKDETKGHKDAYARRKMIKEFLKDLYVNWRMIEGLPVSEPYRKGDAE